MDLIDECLNDSNQKGFDLEKEEKKKHLEMTMLRI